jgi:cyclopropane-fatty-acyl-phospholipid synthase
MIQEDYRDQGGKYDSIVSIEMFEAVGERFWPEYFTKIKSLLKNKGKAVIQTIIIDDTQFARYRKTGDMIRAFIFPGGMLPCVCLRLEN